MKKEKKATEIIDLYIEYADIEGKSKLEGDYKTGNKMVKKINKLSEPFNSNLNLAQEVLNALMDSSSIRARTLAACKALRLGIIISKSLETLEQISKRNDIGILSFSAGMALKIWNEKGHLDP